MGQSLKFGFGRIEAALQEMHGVDPALHSRFKGRLRYLQRAGFGIPRAGVGRRANFTVGHALLFALALELEQFGMAPERVASTIAALGMEVESGTLREAAYEVADRIGSLKPAVLIWFFPEALSDATKGPDFIFDAAVATIGWGELSQLPAEALTSAGATRLALINLSALVAELMECLGVDGSDLARELMEWANSEEDDG